MTDLPSAYDGSRSTIGGRDRPGTQFVDIGPVDDLWDGEMVIRHIGELEVLVLKVAGNVRAYDAACPHQGAPLTEGELHRGVLTCSLHGWQFDADSGTGVNPAGPCLAAHDIRVDTGTIQVRLRTVPAGAQPWHRAVQSRPSQPTSSTHPPPDTPTDSDRRAESVLPEDGAPTDAS